MRKVTSNDGTQIAYATSGSGPSLVTVHGTTADHTRWARLLPELERRFTVHAVDRRGRGASGDAKAYAIEREFEDIAAVVEAVPPPVFLLGHSFGALCSLEASVRTRRLARLVLYEPPIPAGIPIFPPGFVERLQALLAKDDREGVVTTFFREIVRMPEPELATLRSLPNWTARVAAAHTLPREERACDEYVFQPGRFEGVTIPVLLLLGGDSPAFLKRATEIVHAAIASSRVATMPGQQHIAMDTAPQTFLREVTGFLAS